MARKKARRKRSTSEKAFIVVGIIIALSMLLSLFVGLGSSGRSSSSSSNAPLPESERFEAPVQPLGALDGQPAPLAMAVPFTTGPPA
ncbi:MAG: hypothetical protein PVJ75_00970 [Chloroflexota bacterium]|jgi:hypothetical protein